LEIEDDEVSTRISRGTNGFFAGWNESDHLISKIRDLVGEIFGDDGFVFDNEETW
jgi:hypothetical protein